MRVGTVVGVVGEESASSVFFSRSRGGRRRGAKRRRTRRTRRTKSRAYAKSLFDDERAKRSKKILYEGVCSIPGGSKYDSFEGYEVDLSHKSKDFQKWMKDVKFHDPKEFDEWNSETMQVLDEMIEVATRRCEELSLIHISEPTRHAQISYAVFCLKKKN